MKSRNLWNSQLAESVRWWLCLLVFTLVVAPPPRAEALEPFLTGTESDAELARAAEDRDWQVGDVAVTAAIYAAKGWTYFNKKHDVHSAMKQFDTALRLWPNTVLAVIGKAYCLAALGKKAEAVTLLSSCQCKDQITPDVVTLTEIDLLIELKRYEDALAACDKLRDGIPRAYIGSFYPNYNKFTTCSVNGREAFGFDDRSDNLIASSVLVLKNSHSETPSVTVNLNFPLSLVSFRELKQWFPEGVSHPSYLQGCLAHSAFWELNLDRHHLAVPGGDSDSDIVCRFTVTRK